MIELIISGGQTGADLAGLDAALACGVATGGTMPYGFKNEDGYHPKFKSLYGMKAAVSSDYAVRTEINVQDSQVTLWFGCVGSPGFWCTKKATEKHMKAFFGMPKQLEGSGWLTVLERYKVINVAGNRASTNPCIYSNTYFFMVELINRINNHHISHP